MSIAPTFIRDGQDIMLLTGSGAIPIDGDAMLIALEAASTKALRANPAMIFHARKIHALHAQLYELVHRPEPAPVIPLLKPITAKVRTLDPTIWGDIA